jgi:hypothetical protein
MPPGAFPRAMLEAVRQLLYNPLGPHASPSAAEQWCHYIDHLIVTTINMLPHGGWRANHSGGMTVPTAVHSSTLMVPHTSSVACAPMMDLWVELEHYRSGEDGYITIECR